MFAFFSPLLAIVLTLVFGFALSLVTPAENIGRIRRACLASSLLALLFCLLSCLAFDRGTFVGYQFTCGFNFVPEYNLAFLLGVDGLSFIFLLLTLFTFPILFLSAWPVSKEPKQFFCHLMGMELLLVLTFTTIDLFYFFVLFESLLIPMFIMIGTWGARNRKIKAAYYFFLYTFFGSLFMLLGMIYLYHLTGSLNFYSLMEANLLQEDQEFVWLCFFLAFAVKMPLFPLHIWLPEAHVEAPTVGSMLLASLLLKLGGYGFLRFSVTFLAGASEVYCPYVVALALAGVIYGSLSTIRQIDMKRIIAYSSVAHMNLVVLGIFSLSAPGFNGALYLMVAHGVVSAALFFCIGVLYDQTHSRILRYLGGLATTMPLYSTALFVFSLANMAFPGTPNFLGELLTFVGIGSRSLADALMASPGIVLAAVYSTLLFARLCFGTNKTAYSVGLRDLTYREVVIFAVLLVLAIILGLCANSVFAFVPGVYASDPSLVFALVPAFAVVAPKAKIF
jgi:proton-translocating NADH-quinone oxidoreductase chain M